MLLLHLGTAPSPAVPPSLQPAPRQQYPCNTFPLSTIAQAGLELTILLLQPLEYGSHRGSFCRVKPILTGCGHSGYSSGAFMSVSPSPISAGGLWAPPGCLECWGWDQGFCVSCPFLSLGCLLTQPLNKSGISGDSSVPVPPFSGRPEKGFHHALSCPRMVAGCGQGSREPGSSLIPLYWAYTLDCVPHAFVFGSLWLSCQVPQGGCELTIIPKPLKLLG